MTNIYLVRHGPTILNFKKVCQGQIDCNLSYYGSKLARKLGQDFVTNNINFDIYISSPLTRAFRTCNIIKNELVGLKKHIYIVKELNERSYGELEGLSIEEFMKAIEETEITEVKGYEKDDQLIKRILKGLNYILSKFKDKTILIVSHSQVIKSILNYIDPETYNNQTKIPNLNVSHVIEENGILKVNKLSVFENNIEE